MVDKRIFSVFFIVAIVFSSLFPGGTSALAEVQFVSHKLVHTNDVGENSCLREHLLEINFEHQRDQIDIKSDFIIVQDASGSFEHTIDLVTDATKGVLDELNPEHDRAMVVSFQGVNRAYDHRNREIANWTGTPAGLQLIVQQSLTHDFEAVKEGLDSIVTNSGTPTALGLQKALQEYELVKGNEADRNVVFVLITDGVANVQLDGNLYQNTNDAVPPGANSLEYNQDYVTAIDLMKDEGQKIKDSGYQLITGFWEDTEQISGIYADKYPQISQYANDALREMATSPEWFVNANEIDTFVEGIMSVIREGLQVDSLSKLSYTVDEAFELQSVLVTGPNDDEIPVSINGNSFTVQLDGSHSFGEYQVEYTITEKGQLFENTNAGQGLLENNTGEYPIEQVTIADNAKCFIEGSIVVKHVDEEGNELAPTTSKTGEVGTEYQTSPVEIEGYELIEMPANAEGEFTKEEQTVTYVYRPVPPVEGKVIVKHVDEEGNELAPTTSTTGEVGTEYQTSPEEIEGYELIETPANAEGEFTKEEQTVTYVYRPVPTIEGKVIVEYVDEEGNKLKPPTKQTGEVGKEYTTTPKEIEGYELIEIPSNSTGTFTDGEQIVTYIYKKITEQGLLPPVEEDKKEEPKKEQKPPKSKVVEKKDQPKQGISDSGNTLPATATNYYTISLIGIVLLLLGSFALYQLKRKKQYQS